METELEKKRCDRKLSPDYILEADTSQIGNKDVWPKHRRAYVGLVWHRGYPCFLLDAFLARFLTCAVLLAAFRFSGQCKQCQKSVQAALDRKLKANQPARHKAESALGLTSRVEYPTCGGAR